MKKFLNIALFSSIASFACYGQGVGFTTIGGNSQVTAGQIASVGGVTNQVIFNPASFLNQSNVTVINCPTTSLNGLYTNGSPVPSSAGSYAFWNQVGGTNYITQNDPNWYVGDTTYYYNLGPTTNDVGGSGNFFFQNIGGPLTVANWNNSATLMLAFFSSGQQTNFGVTVPVYTNRIWYVNPTQLGNDLNNGQTVLTPFRTLMKAVTIANAGDTISLSEGTFTNDFVNTAETPIQLKTGQIVTGHGNSTVLTNIVIFAADNCQILNLSASSQEGLSFAALDSNNRYILLQNLDWTAPADGLYSGTVAGRLDVRNCVFHSRVDTVNFTLNGQMNVDNTRFECFNTPSNGSPTRTFHMLGGSGTARLNNCTLIISNSFTGTLGGQTNECIGTQGPKVIINNCVLDNSQATNSVVFNLLTGGTVNGLYSDNQSNLLTIGTAKYSGNGSGLTNLVSLSWTNSSSGYLTTGGFKTVAAAGIVYVTCCVTNAEIVWLTNQTTHDVVIMGNVTGVWTNFDNASLPVNLNDSVAVTNISGGNGLLVTSRFYSLH